MHSQPYSSYLPDPVFKLPLACFTDKLYIAVICLALSFSNIVYAQRTKIDSLKKELLQLNGDARINCLNTLSTAYIYLNADSARLFAQKAIDESSQLHDEKGLVTALNNKAHIAGVAMRNFVLQEEICKEAITLCNKLNDKQILADTYLNLALAFFCRGDYDSTVKTCDLIIQLSQLNDIKKQLGEAIVIKGSAAFETGAYEKSFAYFNQGLSIFNSINDSYNTAIIVAKIGDLYRLAGDRASALNFYFQSLEYPKADYFTWHPLVDLGDAYYVPNQYDSTLYESDKYLQSIKLLTIRSNYYDLPDISKAEKKMAEKKFADALTILMKNVTLVNQYNNKSELMHLLLDMAKAYHGEKKNAKAFYYNRELLQYASAQKAKQYLRDGYLLMFDLYDELKRTDSAYFYFKKYTLIKDSVALDIFSKKLAIHQAAVENEKEKNQIDVLNKEKLIEQQQLQISRQQVKNESLKKNILIAGILLFATLGFIIFRNISLKRKNEAGKRQMVEKELAMQKLENEKTTIELRQRATELEMQALRSQMNPHFIFNCLNSINKFIINNEAEKASDYLTKFAKLIRMVLQQSGMQFILLEDEINCLCLYMDLEKSRFDPPFNYEFHYEGVNASAVMIPNLIIQPFVENAIWHGLQPKKGGKGKIDICLKQGDEFLICVVKDNGVGRPDKVQEKINGKVSLGIQLTQDRLQLLNEQDNNETRIVIKDVVDENGKNAGTCVEIKMPVEIIS
ncbi:MAG: histidine kinase [Bacteroidetes bacterium]|nr:histidine kinase [Bacteroidota bacterium]